MQGVIGIPDKDSSNILNLWAAACVGTRGRHQQCTNFFSKFLMQDKGSNNVQSWQLTGRTVSGMGVDGILGSLTTWE